jgi:hypothetical protein
MVPSRTAHVKVSAEIEDLERRNAALLDQRNQVLKEMTALQEKVDQDHHSVDSRFVEMNQRIEELQNDYKRANALREEAVQELQVERRIHEEERIKLENNLHILRANLDVVVAQKDQLTEQHEQDSQRISKLEEEVHRLRSRTANFQEWWKTDDRSIIQSQPRTHNHHKASPTPISFNSGSSRSTVASGSHGRGGGKINERPVFSSGPSLNSKRYVEYQEIGRLHVPTPEKDALSETQGSKPVVSIDLGGTDIMQDGSPYGYTPPRSNTNTKKSGSHSNSAAMSRASSRILPISLSTSNQSKPWT